MGGKNSVEEAHGGGLPGAVVPQKPENLPGVYLQGEAIHRGHLAEPPNQPFGHDRFAVSHHAPFFTFTIGCPRKCNRFPRLRASEEKPGEAQNLRLPGFNQMLWFGRHSCGQLFRDVPEAWVPGYYAENLSPGAVAFPMLPLPRRGRSTPRDGRSLSRRRDWSREGYNAPHRPRREWIGSHKLVQRR